MSNAFSLFQLAGAAPTDEEKEVYAEVEAVLRSSKTILEELRSYEGASDAIRQVKLWSGCM